MVSAHDAYDDWYDDDEPYARGEMRWDERSSGRPLELVRPARLAFEVVRPLAFEDAQRVADRLRDGVPVVIDLHDCDRDLAGRLVDFASGLVYALEGGLQYIGADTLLLTPEHASISGDEECDLREPGFYNRS